MDYNQYVGQDRVLSNPGALCLRKVTVLIIVLAYNPYKIDLDVTG